MGLKGIKFYAPPTGGNATITYDLNGLYLQPNEDVTITIQVESTDSISVNVSSNEFLIDQDLILGDIYTMTVNSSTGTGTVNFNISNTTLSTIVDGLFSVVTGAVNPPPSGSQPIGTAVLGSTFIVG